MPMLHGLAAIVTKEVIQVRRDPATKLVFLLPLVQLIVFGFAVDTDVRDVPTVVFDQDRTTESRRLIERFENTGTFRVAEEVAGIETVRQRIVSGRAQVGVIVPPAFGAHLVRGELATVQVLIDGSDGNVANNAVQTSVYVGLMQAIRAAGARAETLSVEVRPHVLFNPDLASANFYVPGLVGIIMQIVTVFLTAFSIVRERERGTLEQLMVTPVSRGALILGKLLPYAVIGMLQTIFVLGLMRFVFGVEISGDLTLLLGLSVLFLLPSLAIGILISTVAVNQSQALQLGLMIMIPSILLSGFVFPRATMPLPIYLVTFGIPVTFYIQILRGIVLRGAGLWDLWPQTLALAGFTVVLVTASSLRFQKRIR